MLMEPEKELVAYIFGYYIFKNSMGIALCVQTDNSIVINGIKNSLLGSILPLLKISKFACSICKQDYELCQHEEDKIYENTKCEPIALKFEFVSFTGVPYLENSRITDMLVMINDGKEKVAV